MESGILQNPLTMLNFRKQSADDSSLCEGFTQSQVDLKGRGVCANSAKMTEKQISQTPVVELQYSMLYTATADDNLWKDSRKNKGTHYIPIITSNILPQLSSKSVVQPYILVSSVSQ